MQLDQTSLGLPLPHPDNNPRDTDVPRLRAALSLIDTLIVALQDNKAEKAELVAAIDALKGNAPAAYDTLIEIADKLNSNDDVVANILDVLGGKVAKTLAINGKQLTGDITLSKGDIGLPNVDNTPDANKPVSALQAEAIGKRIPYYASGSALPVTDIGPIWHADYAAIMVWDGVGYASVCVGESRMFAFSTVPKGYLLEDGSAISRTVYAALFRRIGTTWGAGDGATTFNLPDSRGEFFRGFDSGRGVDAARTFGAHQDASYVATSKNAQQGLIDNSGGATLSASWGTNSVNSGWEEIVGLNVGAGVQWNALTGSSSGTNPYAYAGRVRPRNHTRLICTKF